MKIKHTEDPAPLRARAYMPIGDQLDAVFKMAKALRDAGIELPADTLAWIAHCEGVKTKYSKRGAAARK